MNLTPIKANMTEMTIGDNKILFSYKTAVAIQNRFGLIYVTEKFWSRTTSRHIKEWLKLRSTNIPKSNIEMPQEYFDNLLNEVSSNYFGGHYQGYGRYQWNVKYYHFRSDFEIELAQDWAFGSYGIYDGKSSFNYLNQIVGRAVTASLEGRSGGWLVIHDELTKKEPETVDGHVETCLDNITDFLIEERNFRATEENNA